MNKIIPGIWTKELGFTELNPIATKDNSTERYKSKNTKIKVKFKYKSDHNTFIWIKLSNTDKYTINRDNGPAIINTWDTGELHSLTWYTNGKKYNKNPNEPTIITFYDTGVIKTKQWCMINSSGIIHRENAPAYIKYDENGNEIEKWWLHEGLLSNFKGPAKIIYNNEMVKEEYFINNEKISYDNWKRLVYKNLMNIL